VLNDLRFGVFSTPSSAQPEAVVELAVLADQVGLDLVTFQDHPYQPKLLDAWTLLSYVAARTTRIRLSPNVLNLPLRPPAVMARAVAALDLLSGGRADLGIGAGGFWDAIEAMGGRRLTPGQGVDALEEAIDVMRALWEEGGHVSYEGRYSSLKRAARGPQPLHAPGVWVGAYKPRMLALTGRKGDGWLPSLPYLQPGDLSAGNAAIDRAAMAAGRDPSAIRRMLNLALPDDPVAEFTRLAREERVDTFIVMTDDPAVIEALARIAAAVRDGASPPQQPDELAITPTPDDGARLSAAPPWDESNEEHELVEPLARLGFYPGQL
jgi:alkanesulfonate monooxygenase SsuD/methylene tetrahydromethanopterin reductase-like flavin-dependent oxidoreductase (luciferase family)